MGHFAVVFPGQGSQHVGMLAELSAQFTEVKQSFDQASEILGYDLWKLSQEGPATKLDQTIYTQPAILCASYSIWKIIQTRISFSPLVFAGHSLGEYTALVCADALDYADAIKLVAARGKYMQEAVADGVGAMAAIIGLTDENILKICEEAKQNSNEILSPANFNSVGQVVISGHKAPVERAIILAKNQGAKLALLLPVSVPSHCDLMRPAADQLSKLLTATPFNETKISVINNVDVKSYTDVDKIRDGLTRQLFSPVRWVDTIKTFIKMDVSDVIECGPGKILSGLIKRIEKNLRVTTTSELENLEKCLKEVRGADHA